jgi:hypothetical protein
MKRFLLATLLSVVLLGLTATTAEGAALAGLVATA